MGRGLTRTRSALDAKRKRTVTRTVAGERVDVSETDGFDELPEETPLDMDVHSKYKTSGNIANKVLQEVLKGIEPSASVMELCKLGDTMINRLTGDCFTKTLDEEGFPIFRGASFPCCISVNTVVCHFHPHTPEEDVHLLEGDIVRIELSVHVDGYIAGAGHTVIVTPASIPSPIPIEFQIQADVLRAAYTAREAALRLMKPGYSNHNVAELLRSVAHSFGVLPMEGVLSHRQKRFEENGTQVILGIQNLEDHQMQETVMFAPGQVWGLDIVFINGTNNKLQCQVESLTDAHIFKRSEVLRSMKTKCAQFVLRQLSQNGPCGMLPFTLDWFDKEDELKAKSGLVMLVKDQLVDAIPPLHCKFPQAVARAKCTVVIGRNEVHQISGLPPPEYAAVDPSRIAADVAELLRQPLSFAAAKSGRKKLKVAGLLK